MIHNWAYSVFIQCKFSKLHYTPALAQYRHALADSWLTKSINTCRRGVYRQVKANTVASMIFISQYDTGIGPLVWCLLGMSISCTLLMPFTVCEDHARHVRPDLVLLIRPRYSCPCGVSRHSRPVATQSNAILGDAHNIMKNLTIGLYREYAIAIQDEVGDSIRGKV